VSDPHSGVGEAKSEVKPANFEVRQPLSELRDEKSADRPSNFRVTAVHFELRGEIAEFAARSSKIAPRSSE
jgi:hypothetical protein